MTIKMSAGDIIAIYAALIGTAGFFLSLHIGLKDRAKIVIKYGRNWKVHPPLFHHDKSLFMVNVANRGRRPVIIEKVGIKLIGGGYLLFMSGPMVSVPVTLTEGKGETFYVEQDDFKWKKLGYVVAYDATGREYKCRIKRSFRKPPSFDEKVRK